MLRRSNGKDRASASRRLEQGRLYKDTTAGTESAPLRRQQGRLCHPAAKQRQRHIMRRDGESSADYAWIQRSNRTVFASRRRSNGSNTAREQPRLCIAAAECGGATAATERLHRDAENREDNARIQRSNGRDRASARPGYQGRPAQWQRQRMHHIGQSREDYASLRRGRE